jgi:hypothetical protein
LSFSLSVIIVAVAAIAVAAIAVAAIAVATIAVATIAVSPAIFVGSGSGPLSGFLDIILVDVHFIQDS